MAPIGHRRDGNGASSRGEAAVERARRELVPGELIRLVAGDRVPADTQLREARDLHVQQAALTGESAPVEKEAGGPAQSGLDARDRVYLGTSVVAGVATAVVLATGPQPRSVTSPRAWARGRRRPSSSAAWTSSLT